MREQRTRSAGMTSSRAKITLRRKPRQGSNSTCHATLRSDAYYFVVPLARGAGAHCACTSSCAVQSLPTEGNV
jgi:hypothetical protein